jgi:hypothetical protein
VLRDATLLGQAMPERAAAAVMQLRNNDARLKHLLSRDGVFRNQASKHGSEDPVLRNRALKKNICSQKTRLQNGAFIETPSSRAMHL